jgi:hypothetical protein
MAILGQYNLDEMTEQEAFEASAIHLMNQSAKSLSETGCLYNGLNNLCCAAGIFIQGYKLDMETLPWSSLVEDFNQSSNHKDLITCLQIVHDSSLKNVDSWIHRLKLVAKDFNLDSKFLDKWHYDTISHKHVKV